MPDFQLDGGTNGEFLLRPMNDAAEARLQILAPPTAIWFGGGLTVPKWTAEQLMVSLRDEGFSVRQASADDRIWK